MNMEIPSPVRPDTPPTGKGRKARGVKRPPGPVVPVAAPLPSPSASQAAAAAPAALASRPDTPWILQIWARLRCEPGVLLTVAYLAVSCLGLWANFWFYRGFGVPILEYMQPSDYLVGGLRDPVYGLLLLACVAISILVSWPETYRHRQPARVAMWQRHWWGPVVFPENRWMRWKLLGVTPETGIALVAAWGMMWASASYVDERGASIRDGKEGARVLVASGEGVPAREARLLGSSGMFVFVWWPDARVAEVIPIEALAGLQYTVDMPAAKPAAPPRRPVAEAVQANPAVDALRSDTTRASAGSEGTSAAGAQSGR